MGGGELAAKRADKQAWRKRRVCVGSDGRAVTERVLEVAAVQAARAKRIFYHRWELPPLIAHSHGWGSAHVIWSGLEIRCPVQLR